MKQMLLTLFASLVLASGVASTASAYDIQKVGGKIQISVDPRELFSAQGEKMIDVLFVIDNSGSMSPFQNALSSHIDYFAHELKDLNINAGVLTTDAETINGQELPGIINWVSSKNPDWNDQLKKNLLVGTMGSATEQPLASIAKSISDPQYKKNANFFRANSNLAIVLLTDAEDQSTISVDALAKQLAALKPNRKISIHGLIVPSTLDAPTRKACTSEDTPSPRLESIIKNFNGVIASLCTPATFESGVQDIVKDINNSTRSVKTGGFFTLPFIPDLSTLQIVYGKPLIGGDADYGWVYHKQVNQLQFGNLLDWNKEPVGTELMITYTPLDWKQ